MLIIKTLRSLSLNSYSVVFLGLISVIALFAPSTTYGESSRGSSGAKLESIITFFEMTTSGRTYTVNEFYKIFSSKKYKYEKEILKAQSASVDFDDPQWPDKVDSRALQVLKHFHPFLFKKPIKYKIELPPKGDSESEGFACLYCTYYVFIDGQKIGFYFYGRSELIVDILFYDSSGHSYSDLMEIYDLVVKGKSLPTGEHP